MHFVFKGIERAHKRIASLHEPPPPRPTRYRKSMRKPLLITLLPCLAGGLLALCGSLRVRSTPSYAGRSADHWMACLNESNPHTQEQALIAFKHMGEEAVPFLILTLKEKDSTVRKTLKAIGKRVPFFHVQSENRAMHRARAAAVLKELGPSAYAAVPDLIETLGDRVDYVADGAERALEQIGPASVKPLVTAVFHSNVNTRRRSVSVLGHLGVEARSAERALVLALRDASPDVRAEAALALGNLGTVSEFAIRALARSLMEESVTIRVNAAGSLGKFGHQSAPATPALVNALEDLHSAVRVKAAHALGRVGAFATSAVPALAQNLENSSAMVRASCALALGRIGPGAASAIHPLIAALEDPDPQTRLQSARSLGKIGPAADQAVPALTKALRDDSLVVRICAIEALGEIGRAAKHAVPRLIEMLNNDPSGMGGYVRTTLLSIQPDGLSAQGIGGL